MSIEELLSGSSVKSWSQALGRKLGVGDTISGVVVKAAEVQQRVIKDDGTLGELIFWDPPENMRPKMMVAVVLDTGAKGEKDDGHRSVYFSGNAFTALQEAARAAVEAANRSDRPKPDIREGDHLTVSIIGKGTPQNRAWDAPNLYAVEQRFGSSVPSLSNNNTPATSAPSAVAHGPKPDSIPDAAWAVMDDKARALVSPAQTAAAPSAAVAHGPKPDYLPDSAWSVMTPEQRAQVSPAVQAGPSKPDYLPQAAWDAMSAEEKAALPPF